MRGACEIVRWHKSRLRWDAPITVSLRQLTGAFTLKGKFGPAPQRDNLVFGLV